MSPYKRNVQGYQQVQVGTASPEKLLLMVYDGAIKFFKSSKLMAEKGQDLKSASFAFKGIECITELLGTLNHEAAPEFAAGLKSIYLYIVEKVRLFLADKRTQDLDEAVRLLEGLKNSWEEAFTAQEIASLKKTG